MVYEIKRLKNCADLIRDGVMFHQDVAVLQQSALMLSSTRHQKSHTHKIIYAKPSETSGAAETDSTTTSFPSFALIFLIVFFDERLCRFEQEIA